MLKGWNLLIQTYIDILNGMPAASFKIFGIGMTKEKLNRGLLLKNSTI